MTTPGPEAPRPDPEPVAEVVPEPLGEVVWEQPSFEVVPADPPTVEIVDAWAQPRAPFMQHLIVWSVVLPFAMLLGLLVLTAGRETPWPVLAVVGPVLLAAGWWSLTRFAIPLAGRRHEVRVDTYGLSSGPLDDDGPATGLDALLRLAPRVYIPWHLTDEVALRPVLGGVEVSWRPRRGGGVASPGVAWARHGRQTVWLEVGDVARLDQAIRRAGVRGHQGCSGRGGAPADGGPLL